MIAATGLSVIAPPGLASALAAESEAQVLIDRAYASFRSAYWYARTGNPGVAALELMSLSMRWASLRDAFEAAPPAPYDTDPDWPSTLATVDALSAQAMDQLNSGAGDEGFETIARLRPLFADLRRRNGITAFADHVDAYSRIIDELSPYRVWERELSEDDWVRMAALGEDTETAIARMRDKAPADLSADPDFERLLNTNADALMRYRSHVANRNDRGAKGSIRDLRSAYGLLFLKYG